MFKKEMRESAEKILFEKLERLKKVDPKTAESLKEYWEDLRKKEEKENAD